MNLSKVVLRLYGCVYKILRLVKVKVAYSGVIVSAGLSTQVHPSLCPAEGQFSIFALRNLC